MREGRTTAPANLTEAELITLMDKHGIGTDATHAEHISKVIERGWIYSIHFDLSFVFSITNIFFEGSFNLKLVYRMA